MIRTEQQKLTCSDNRYLPAQTTETHLLRQQRLTCSDNRSSPDSWANPGHLSNPLVLKVTTSCACLKWFSITFCARLVSSREQWTPETAIAWASPGNLSNHWYSKKQISPENNGHSKRPLRGRILGRVLFNPMESQNNHGSIREQWILEPTIARAGAEHCANPLGLKVTTSCPHLPGDLESNGHSK